MWLLALAASALRRAALAVPTLALAGAPLTSGMLAKDGLKQALAALPAPWPDLVGGLLPLAALGTALLMARLIWLAWRLPIPSDALARPPGLHAPWFVAVLASALLPWVLGSVEARQHAFQLAGLATASWPLLAAAALAAAAVLLRLRTPALPPGDLLHPLARGIERLRGNCPRWRLPDPPDATPHLPGLPRPRGGIMTTHQTGVGWLALLAGLILLLGR